jgi:hypothetical protein
MSIPLWTDYVDVPVALYILVKQGEGRKKTK